MPVPEARRPGRTETGRRPARPPAAGRAQPRAGRRRGGATAARSRSCAPRRSRPTSRLELPTWRRSGFWTTSLRDLDVDALEPATAAGDSIPDVVTDALGDQKLAGLLVQRGASVVHTELDPELAAQGVILCSLEDAARDHPELFAAALHEAPHATTATSSRPRAPRSGPAARSSTSRRASSSRTRSRSPTSIDEAGTAQYAHTLAIGGAQQRLPPARVRPRPRLRGPGAARRRLRALPRGRGARCRLAHLQDWGGGAGGLRRLHALRQRRARRALHVAPVHLGGHLTRQHLELATAEPGGDMRHPRHLLHRARRAPRPVHRRPARGRPDDRRHGVAGRGHGREPRELRGPDQDRPGAQESAHLPADALDDALAQGARSTPSRR